MRRISVCLLVAIALALSLFSKPVRAQALADRVPADSIVYFGWKGAAAPNSGYQGSHLQAVLTAADYKAKFDQALPQLLEAVQREDADAAKAIEIALSMAGPLMRHPTAIFLAPNADENMPLRFGLICHAGAESKSLAAKINELLDKAPDVKKDVRVVESADSIAVLLGYDEAGANGLLAAPPAQPLSRNELFVTAMKQAAPTPAPTPAPAGEGPFLTFYVDTEAALKWADKLIAQNDADTVENWSRARDAMGFTGLRRVTILAGFEGQAWSTSVFVDAPAPRKGFVKLMEGRPIEPEALRLIPQSAGAAQLHRFDVAALFNEIRNVVEAVDPDEGVANFDRAIGGAQMFLGVNPITDVLEPMGDTWLIYTDAGVAGNSTEGIIVLNKLDDAAKAQRGFNAVWTVVSNFVNQQQGRMPFVSISRETLRDVEVAVLNIEVMQSRMAWAIRDDRLIIGMHPDAVALAATKKHERGFDQNETFAQLARRLAGDNPITTFEFSDLPATAPAMHDDAGLKWAMARTAAGEEGIELPEEILPPIDAVMKHLSPAARISWTDAGGFHTRSIEPFPGSQLYSSAPSVGSAQVGVVAMGTAILLPSLNRARETANRVKCASNERQIAQGILLYANEHRGAYPPDLGTLVKDGYIDILVFTCPAGNNSIPANHATMTPDEKAAWANEHGDYVFVGQGLNNATTPADRIIIHEKLDNHDHDGINMCFGDGHVEFVLQDDATRRLEALKEEMKEQKK